MSLLNKGVRRTDSTMPERAMNPWFGKAIIIASSLVMVIIRAPHGRRSREELVVRSRKGVVESTLLAFAWLAFFVPLFWVGAPVFSFADYPLRLTALFFGVGCLAVGLWLFGRTQISARTGRLHSRCARGTNSSPRASTATSAIPCTAVYLSIPSARRSWYPTGLRARPTASPWCFSAPFASAPKSE